MTIRPGISRNPDERHCDGHERRRRSAGNPGGGRMCSTGNPRPAQKRGPAHDGSSASDLVVKLAPLVKRIAFQLRGRLPAHVELDDLVSDGTVGLIDAVRKFDPAKGVTIESYARYRIRGAMLDSLRDQDYASRDMRRRVKKVESTCQTLERSLGRAPEAAEMASAMGMGLERWHERAAELQRLGFEGTGARFLPDSSRRVNEEDLPASQDASPFELCYRREQRDLLSRALRCLSERERSIIALYYKKALTMKQIGCRLGIDESRVSQLHSGAISRLRSRVADRVCLRPDGRGSRRPAPGPWPAPSTDSAGPHL